MNGEHTSNEQEKGSIIHWQPISTAPWNKTVLLTGDSGYAAPHDKFIINGYREKDWHGGNWNDATGTPLRDAGWEPTHWA